jgi:hypothetical protein
MRERIRIPEDRNSGSATGAETAAPLGCGDRTVRKKPTNVPETKGTLLYRRIRKILESARTTVARSVNTTPVVANWLIGREIVEEEQRGKRRAGYGEKLLKDLSDRLTKDCEKGWSVGNLEYCRNFYVEYPLLIDIQKSNAVRSIFAVTSTLGLILCTDKNDAVVHYTLGPDQANKIFASRYKLHLPTEVELRAELRRELRLLKMGFDSQS